MQQNFITWMTKGGQSSAYTSVAPTFGHPEPCPWSTDMFDLFHYHEKLRVVDRDWDGSKIHFLLNMMKDISLHLLMSRGRSLVRSVDLAAYDRHISVSLSHLKEASWLEN